MRPPLRNPQFPFHNPQFSEEDTMTVEIHASAPVYTADGEWVGDVLRLYKRLGEVNPQLRWYAFYLMVVNLHIGTDFYIPVDFVERYDAQEGRLVLNVSMKRLMHETVIRMPDFVVRGAGAVVPLPASIELATAALVV